MPKVRGDGSIVQLDQSKSKARCRRWKLVVRIGYDDNTERYKRKTRNFTGTYTEAKEALKSFVNELQTEKTVDGRITFNEFADQWINARIKAPRYAKRTTDGEIYKLKNVRLHIGTMKMKDITADVINELYAKLAIGETSSGKPLCGTSIRNTHKTLNTLLKDAIRAGELSQDAIKGIIIPKNDSQERTPLSQSKAKEIIDKLDPVDAMQMIVLVCITCGVRRSEAVAMNLQDYDAEGLHVRKAAEDDATLKDPKARKSSRSIPCPPQTREKLSSWILHQKILMANKGISQGPETPLFTNGGERYKPHSVTSWWMRHREKDFGVSCTLHDLRHTYATILMQQGVSPRIVQELIGDETLEVVMKIYSHVSSDDKRNAVSTLENVF